MNASIETFLDEWPDSPDGCRRAFQSLAEHLSGLGGATVEFHPRPGISYSLRGGHPALKQRPLFAMIDVIEDTPRWLSVCFYEEMVSDPEDRGDTVPGGLLGEDGICFDIDAADDALLAYVKQRISEAHRAAGG